MKKLFHLTLVTNKGCASTSSYLQFIQQCIHGGITCVQLREKSLSQDALLDFGFALKHLLDSNDIPLIINDNLNLCLELDAAGVHLGQSDTEPVRARSLLGHDKIIGLSVNTMEQVKNANRHPVDYIGLGAIFPTHNKPDIETIWGLNGLRQATKFASHPIVAIGGIDENNAQGIMHAGASGIAAIGAFHLAKDPCLLTQKLLGIINSPYAASSFLHFSTND